MTPLEKYAEADRVWFEKVAYPAFLTRMEEHGHQFSNDTQARQAFAVATDLYKAALLISSQNDEMDAVLGQVAQKTASVLGTAGPSAPEAADSAYTGWLYKVAEDAELQAAFEKAAEAVDEMLQAEGTA
jgi:hypothetical protein